MQTATAELLKYIDASPTAFHATAETRSMLIHAGFRELRETDAWQIEAGPGYFVTRNDSSLIAFRVQDLQQPLARVRVIGAHTDSPNLRLKPNPTYEKVGYTQLGVEVYGGVLLNSWLDRDLSIAGRVTFRAGNETRSSLVRFEDPLCRVAQLAIHLDRKIGEDGLQLNRQEHMPPLLGVSSGSEEQDARALAELISEKLGIADPADILASELHLYPTEASTCSGLAGEFIHAPRLDNLAMCHAATSALLGAVPPAGSLNVVAFFDNEEVGSQSAQGAGSPFLGNVLERVALGLGQDRGAFLALLPASSFISADMAHSVHPNYPERHDEHHAPIMNAGPVIKVNSNQRYATNSETAALLEGLARDLDVPTQRFVNRTDLACGSTIGPITAANLGIPTVDVGNAMLSMHSAREMAGAEDPDYILRLFRAYFEA